MQTVVSRLNLLTIYPKTTEFLFTTGDAPTIIPPSSSGSLHMTRGPATQGTDHCFFSPTLWRVVAPRSGQSRGSNFSTEEDFVLVKC